jgi:phage-related protein
MKYYFLWNGTDSRTKGIRLQEMPQIIRPEERVSHVVIPGRAGDVTMTEGDDIYEPYIQTIPMVIDNASDVHAAETWLRGSAYVTFCCQPDRSQAARVINAVQFRKHSKNSSWYEGEVQFYCQPLKSSRETEEVTITSSGTLVNNPGDVVAKPYIVVVASGTVTIQIGGRTIMLEGMGYGDPWKIDSSLEWVMDRNDNPLMGVWSGQFPRMVQGNNTVLFTGDVSYLVLYPRSRYI